MKNIIITTNTVKEIRCDDDSMDLLREIIEDNPDMDISDILTEYFDTAITFKNDKAETSATRLIEKLRTSTEHLQFLTDNDGFDDESDADSVCNY
jgi:hypothetical protein